MSVALFAALAIIATLFFRAARRDRGRRLAAAATVSFEVDGNGVRRTLADGRHEEVRWDELGEVRLVTLPKGPWGERIRIVLDGGDERGCIVPWDVAESGGLPGGLHSLTGFDLQRLFAAVEAAKPGQVVLWRKEPAAST